MQTDFKIFVPAEVIKSVDGSEKGNYVRGWASTPDKDKQGDAVLPKGINITKFLNRGYINYEHEKGDDKIIGVPTRNSFVDPDKGLFVEAKLFMDNPFARKMWDLASNIKKSGEDRPLGFSIEGFALSRDTKDASIITRVDITNVALTVNPANENATWEALVKSMTTGYEHGGTDQTNGSALRRQSLATKITDLTYGIKDTISKSEDWDEIAQLLDNEERYDEETAIILLQLSTGCSRDDAISRLLDSKKEDLSHGSKV